MPIPITNAELDFYKLKGATHIRMPLNFTVLYPTKFGPLDPTYLATIKSILTYAQSIGLDVKIDPHSFGGWNGYRVGSPDFPPAAFADYWGKLAVACLGYTNVRFDLMNEWAGPGPSNIFPQDYLQNSSIAAIKAIRGVGFTNWIYAEGNAYSGVWNWVNSNPGFENVIYADPLGKTKVSAHTYLDHDSSGGNFDWNTEVAITDPLVLGPTSLDVGVQRCTVWVNWCKQFGFAMHLGEFGIPNGDTRWIEAGRRTLAYLQTNNVEVDIWAAGPAWGNYPMSLEGFAGRQSKQWPMLQEFSGSTAQPSVYFMDGPTRGTQATVSAPYTFEYRGRVTSPITLTPNDGGLGGTFNPSTVVLANGDNPTGTCTYTPAITGTISVGVTNNRSLTNPPSIGMGTLDDAYLHLTSQYPITILALRRVYSAYTGPAIKLLRLTDNTMQDFYFTATGDLPRQAIQDWASSNTPKIVTVYDQSPSGNHLSIQSPYNAVLTLSNTQGYPEITWPYGTFGNINVPTNGLISFSGYMRARDAGGNSCFMRQDWFVGPYLIGPGTFNVYNGTIGASVNFSQGNVYATYGYSWVSNITGGIKGYLNGVFNSSADTPAMTMSPAYGQGSAEMGYFKFYTAAQWSGAWQEFTLLGGALSATQVADFHNRSATYYGTALAPLGGLAPAINGISTAQSVYNFTYGVPFAGVTITDQNGGSPTDSATITITGDSHASLTGTGLTGSNPYTIAPTTAATLTSTLSGLHYQTTSTVGQTATMTVVITSSASRSATSTITLTTIASQPETPFAAPTGTWTPIAGNATYKGVNIGGGENSFPTNNGYNYAYPFDEEIDYFASKGMGLIRVLIASGRFFPVAYGLADPPGARASGDVPNLYRPFPAGSRTNVLSLKAVLDHAYTKGVRVLIDPHGYASVFDGRVNTNINAGPGEGANLLADQLGRLATLYKNYPNVVWSLNNEPVGCSAANWYVTACQCVAAIRAAGATQKIFISVGGTYDSALEISAQGSVWDNFNQPGWTGNNGDPLDNFAIELHAYLDSNNSGIIDNVRYTGFGNDVLVAATNWCKKKSDGTARAKPFKAFLGEFGTSTSAAPMVELNNELNYMSNNSDVWLGWSFFLGGSFLFFQGYTYGYVGPGGMGSGGPYTDKPQMAYLVSHLP